MSATNVVSPATAAQLKNEDKTIFGFWVYIMTDCVLFASLFAVYAVLHHGTNGGPGGQQLFDLPYVLRETLLLLTSSFTCGLGMVAAKRGDIKQVYVWFLATFLLGLLFVGLEVNEFHHLIETGNSWRRSGFLSSYFVLVATHGLHITVGLLWMTVLMVQLKTRGLTRRGLQRLDLLSIFWHFLDVVWIFIFTIVYLFGVVGQ